MVTPITGNVMSTALVSVCGRYTVATCHILTLASLKWHQLLSGRYIKLTGLPLMITYGLPVKYLQHITALIVIALSISLLSKTIYQLLSKLWTKRENQTFNMKLQNLRPEIPRCCPSALANVMKRCWDANPDKRPEMDEVVTMLEAIDTSKGGGMIPIDHPQGCFCFRRYRGPWNFYSLRGWHYSGNSICTLFNLEKKDCVRKNQGNTKLLRL